MEAAVDRTVKGLSSVAVSIHVSADPQNVVGVHANGSRADEGLFRHMAMSEDASIEKLAIGIEDFPPIRILCATGLQTADADGESGATCCGLSTHRDHIGQWQRVDNTQAEELR